jgi:multimeric flavodoxin WrbA
MNLHYCTGCWSCWWKTPGECAIKDDAEQIFRAVINSELIVFASPLIAGFTSAMLKKIQDRLIVLLHPYLQINNGESHHRRRYDKYPEFGVIIDKEGDTDEEDLKIVKDIYDRLAINFHSKQRFIKFVDEIDSIAIEHR